MSRGERCKQRAKDRRKHERECPLDSNRRRATQVSQLSKCTNSMLSRLPTTKSDISTARSSSKPWIRMSQLGRSASRCEPIRIWSSSRSRSLAPLGCFDLPDTRQDRRPLRQRYQSRLDGSKDGQVEKAFPSCAKRQSLRNFQE